MSAAPAVKPMPVPQAQDSYDGENERRYRREITLELSQKHDKRSDLRLSVGKSLIFTSVDGVEYAIGLDADALLTLTNYATGEVGSFSVDRERVSGLSEQLALITTAYETDDAALSALISINASAITTNEGAIATLETDLAAEVSARTTGDSGLQTQVNARATISYVDTVIATEESARASADSALQAQITSNDGDITSINATVTTHTTAIADLDATKAEASTVTALTATVTTIGTDLDAAEADIVTNTAAISTNATAIATAEDAISSIETEITAARDGEASLNAKISSVETAYASADSAIASDVSTLEARVTTLAGSVLPERPSVVTDFSGDTTGAPSAVADLNGVTVTTVAGEGEVAEISAARFIRHKGALPVLAGHTYRITVRVACTVDGTDNRLRVSFRTLDKDWANSFVHDNLAENPHTVSDGWQTYTYERTAAQLVSGDADAAYVLARAGVCANNSGAFSGATVQVAIVRLEDITDAATNSAAISSEATTRASADSALASDISTIEAEVTAARDGEASLSAKIGSVETAFASADTAIAADVTALDARVTTNEGDITSIESAATALDARVATVEADYATATSVTALTATVSGNTSDIAGNTADIATNAAAITTEASARASADSAAASRLDALEATVDTPTTGLSAVVSGHTTAIADLDSTKAEASDLTSLTSTVSTLSSDLDTAEATIATNTASITSEASTRASADSAIASDVTALQVRVAGRESGLLSNALFQEEFSGTAIPPGWSNGASGQGTWGARTTGDGYAFTLAGGAGTNDYIFQTTDVAAGQKILVSAECELLSGTFTGSGFRVRFRDGGGSTVGSDNDIAFATAADTSGTISGSLAGVRRWEQEFTVPATAVDVRIYAISHLSTFGSISSANSLEWRECNVAPVSLAQASVTTNATAIADIEGNLSAAYGVTVDVNGRIAALKLLSDGTSATAALLGDLIYFGDNTVFEDTYNTFYTTYSSYRLRSMGPFGSSSDLLLWYGPTSVSLNSETKTNGVMALATDGKLYVGSDPANALSGVTLDSYFQLGFTSAGTGYSDTVTATAIGGDGTYTYLWTRTGEAGPTRTTCSNTGIQTPTFSVAAGGTSADTWTCTITETSTGRSYQASVKFDVSLI